MNYYDKLEEIRWLTSEIWVECHQKMDKTNSNMTEQELSFVLEKNENLQYIYSSIERIRREIVQILFVIRK